MPTLDIRVDQRQSQTLSPRLQRAVRLLQMSSLDFAAMLRETMGKNPFLEADEGDGDDPQILTTEAAMLAQHTGELRDEKADAAEPAQGASAGDDFPESDEADYDGSSDRDLWHADGGNGVRRGEDGGLSALDMMAAETALNAHLHTQLNVLNLSERDLALGRTVIESLDDDGYLRTSLEDLLDVPPLEPAPTLQEMQIALKRVQSLDPAGVGARTVSECLLLQLPAVECPLMRDLARAIVSDHMQMLAARDVHGLARVLGVSPTRATEICDRIRRLDPRPGWRLASSRAAYVVPDVIVKRVRGQWTVELNPAVIPKLRLNQVYAQLFQRHRTAQNAEMGAHLYEARWTLRNVEQRFCTIYDVACAIVKRQRNFLEYGPMAMKPLGLREIAEEVGIHESTVSRVTNNKYMSTPMGVFELKHFFSRAMVTDNGSACSGTAIRGLIKDIIEAEQPEAPLSDAEIARQLARQGLRLARRTVTKYRQMLRIEAVDRRRRCV